MNRDPASIGKLRRAGWLWLADFVMQRPLGPTVAILAGAVATLFNLPALWLARFALDKAIPAHSAAALLAAGGGVLACRALAAALVLAAARWTLPQSRAIVADLRSDLHSWLLRLRWSDYSGLDQDRAHARLVHDTGRIELLVNGLVYAVLPMVIPLCIYLAVLFWISWPIALAVVITAPLTRFGGYSASLYLKQAVAAFQQRYEAFHVGAYRSLKMLRVTRLQGAEDKDIADQHDRIQALAGAGAKMAMANLVSQQASALSTTAIVATVLVVGGIGVIHGVMSVGTLAAFVVASTQVSAAIGALGGGLPLVLSADDALIGIAELRAAGKIDVQGGVPPRRGVPAVAFEEVSFAHDQRPILARQSFRVERFAITAIAAPSGAGKTTILELAAGLLRPGSGRVVIDGTDLARIDGIAWRRSVGIVPQVPPFVRGSIRENICFGRAAVDGDALDRAIHLSGLEPVLRRLSDGLDAYVGDDGRSFSGGELQRMAIARALVHSPHMLIMDEPSNHLDAATVDLITKRLFASPDRPTILMATHDARLLALSDHVFRLADGVLNAQARTRLETSA